LSEAAATSLAFAPAKVEATPRMQTRLTEMKVVPFTVFRKDNRRRRIRDWRLYVRVAVAVVFVCAIVVGLYVERALIKRGLTGAAAFVFNNPYFSVREIQVRGGGKVGGSEIVAMAGLRHGMNLWNVDAAAIEHKLLRHPSVRRVLVRREFPRRIVIDVEERQPRALVALGKLYYVDSDGFLFKEVGEGEKADFPLLTGLRADDLLAGGPALRRRLQEAMSLGELMQRDARKLSEIHFEAADRLVLYVSGQPIALRMGWGDWQNKIERMNRACSHCVKVTRSVSLRSI
jgi:cell division protein FtsQ